jgi:hypothetical protein
VGDRLASCSRAIGKVPAITRPLGCRGMFCTHAATKPYSAKCPCTALMCGVRRRTSRLRVRKIVVLACDASLFTAMKRIVGRCADCFGIRHVLLPLNKPLYVGRRYQSGRMAKTPGLTSPIMSTRTCLHGNDTWLRQAGKGYVLGIEASRVFLSWGKRRIIAGAAARDCQSAGGHKRASLQPRRL